MPGDELPAGVAQRPRAKSLDHPRFLGDGDELGRADHAALRIAPAQQRLHAERPAGIHVDLRLIDKEELIVHHPAPHVGLELQARLYADVHVRGVEAGRNAYRFYTADMNVRVQARLQLETDMRRGMMDDEFFLVYQPQIDMDSGRALGVEALLRWRDPERGVIGPAEFIPIAEESGMIQALGARALRDACRQVVAWHRQNMMLRLSVNLSVQQLQHDNWLSVVEDALRASGLAPRYLDLEITESVIITHHERAVATLEKLKQMGVSITLDDFGMGYSNLIYLARLPIQGIKIERQFVHGLEQNRNDEAITQLIIALSHSMGLRVIAEGVETVAQFEFLKNHGCQEAQGYLISRPLEAPELRSWWVMQEEENRIVGRQPDMWRAQAK